jgi:hypothetical protein
MTTSVSAGIVNQKGCCISSRASARARHCPLARDRSAKVYSQRALAVLFDRPYHTKSMPRYMTTSVSAGIVKPKGLLAFELRECARTPPPPCPRPQRQGLLTARTGGAFTPLPPHQMHAKVYDNTTQSR